MHTPETLIALYDKTFTTNDFNSKSNRLYSPVNHIMQMKGKKIRPLLVLSTCDMFSGNVELALNPAYCMELFHNFTLVHDDIMDNSDIRRGVPTVHKVYGTNSAILAGDVMLAYAYKYLLEVPNQYVADLMRLFTNTAIEIFEGQQMDVDFETRNDVTVDEYLKMIEYKTSVLLACCAQTGAIVAGANEHDQKAVYDFGLNLGLSFQIMDDWLDAFGEGEKVGKRIGGDILLNKKTFLYITTLNLANQEQRNTLLAMQTETDEQKKIDTVKSIMLITGAEEATRQKAQELYELSLKSMDSVSVAEDRKVILRGLAETINRREF